MSNENIIKYLFLSFYCSILLIHPRSVFLYICITLITRFKMKFMPGLRLKYRTPINYNTFPRRHCKISLLYRVKHRGRKRETLRGLMCRWGRFTTWRILSVQARYIYIYIAGVESVSENLGRWKASSGEREKVGRSKATGSENFALCFSCKIKIVKSSRVNIFAFCTF